MLHLAAPQMMCNCVLGRWLSILEVQRGSLRHFSSMFYFYYTQIPPHPQSIWSTGKLTILSDLHISIRDRHPVDVNHYTPLKSKLGPGQGLHKSVLGCLFFI